jgi:hypothetical protein
VTHNAFANLSVPHFIRGSLVRGEQRQYDGFSTPSLDLDGMTWSRALEPPAANVPIAEIVDVLVTLGGWLTDDPDGLIEQAFLASCARTTLERGVLERSYKSLGLLFDRRAIEFQITQDLGHPDVIDGWRPVMTASGRQASIRAFPSRLIHIIAGNSPGVSAMTVIWAALTKGVSLIKIPSNDLFTATAILQGLARVAPGHPLVSSFVTAYWRGGDREVESLLYRPTFFDKLVAWGGEGTIRAAKQYIGPGFELITFDPKTSISMIGREVHESDQVRTAVADASATDVTFMDQQACCASRFQFVEGSIEEVDAYCTELQHRLGVERPYASARGGSMPQGVCDEIEAMRYLAPDYRVFGGMDGRGVVIRSEEPVSFYPDGRVVNVIRVDNLRDALSHANVATQTVGVYPSSRRGLLRDRLASRGVQRVVSLGSAANMEMGLPHDGFRPLQRFVRWVNDED